MSPEERERLGRIAYDHLVKNSPDTWETEPDWVRGECFAVAEAVADAVRQTTPAAIVQRVTGEFHLFEDAMDAQRWMRTNSSPEHGYFHSMSVQSWAWHPKETK